MTWRWRPLPTSLLLPLPAKRGEGRGEGLSPRVVADEVSCGDSAPLTPTLSPQGRGEGVERLCGEEGARGLKYNDSDALLDLLASLPVAARARGLDAGVAQGGAEGGL